MSAWARLVTKAQTPEEVADLSAALQEIQTEAARRLAQRIRNRIGAVNEPGTIWYAEQAADFIDPDVP